MKEAYAMLGLGVCMSYPTDAEADDWLISTKFSIGVSIVSTAVIERCSLFRTGFLVRGFISLDTSINP